MATALPIKYALDLTGTSLNNAVVGEIVTTVERSYKVIVPKSTPFYAESFNLWDDGTNVKLEQGVDYKLVEPVGMPTVLSGKVVYSMAVVTKKSTTNRYRIDYQCVGGGYQSSYEAIRMMLENASNDARPISWPNVVNRDDTFPPTMHLHSAGDLVGFEYLITTLEKLRDAVILGDSIGHDEILLYMQSKIDALVALMNDGQNSLIALAISRATGAASEASRASVYAQGADAKANQALVNSQLTQTTLGDMRSIAAGAEASARSILNSYPSIFESAGTASNLNFTPSTQSVGPLMFPANEATGLISTDYYGITTDGKTVMGQAGDTSPARPNTDYVFMARLSTTKLLSGGQAQIDLRINLFDHRGVDLTGYYGSNCSFTILPIEIDDGSNQLVSVFASTASYVYAETPRDGQIKGATFIVDAVDTQASPLATNTAQQAVNANKISQYLLDCRADYNVLGHGVINARRGVNFSLPTGSELLLSFKLSGTSVAEVRKRITAIFRHRIDVMRSVRNATLLSTQNLIEGPDTSKFRSICCSF